jgi:hypothetical protein
MERFNVRLRKPGAHPTSDRYIGVMAPSERSARAWAEQNHPYEQIISVERETVLDPLLQWMDGHFDHNLTNIFINTTIIGRGVDMAFRSPQLREFVFLKQPIQILLQTGFSREYRHQNWQTIISSQAYGHVIDHFSGASLDHLPEAKSAIVASINHIHGLLDQG